MALEYDVIKYIPGKRPDIIQVTRDEGQTDEDYRGKAHQLAEEMRDQLGQTGVSANVRVCYLDAVTPEEIAADRASFIASGLTPADLPTLRDVLAGIGMEDLLDQIGQPVEN